MSVLKIIIADTNQNFCEWMARYICFRKDLKNAGISGDGEEAVHLIQEKKPDILVMDPMVENSIALLSYLQKNMGSLRAMAFFRARGRLIIPISSLWSDGPREESASRAAELCEYIRTIPVPASADEKDEALELQISGMMRQLGIPAHLKGYRYLRKAILTAIKEPDVMDGITKILYPDIAKYYGTTASCVERNMRKAIEIAWDRGNIDFLQHYFGYTIKPRMGKPTNSEFIATVADILYLQQDHPGLPACV